MTVAAFLEDALRAVADSFDPLRGALGDISSLRAFLQEFGWELDPGLDASHFDIIGQIFSVEILLLDALPNADVETLAASLPSLIASLLRDRTPDPGWPAPFNSNAFWSGVPPQFGFPRELLDGLLYDIIGDRIPIAFGILRFIGVFDEQVLAAVPASGNVPARLEYTRRSIDWTLLGPAISSPQSIFTNVYHWDDANSAFDHAKLLRNIAALFEGLPVGSSVVPSSPAAFALFYDGVATSPQSLQQLTVLPLSYQAPSGPVFGAMKLSLNALPIPAKGSRTGPPIGIGLFPLISGQLQSNITLAEGITVTLSGAYSAVPVIAEIRPAGLDLTVPPAAGSSVDAEARLDAQAGASPWRLLGSADSARFELSQLHFSLKATGSITDPIFTIEVGLDKAAIVIDFGDSDSLLKSVFGGTPQRFELGFAASWSNKGGFRVSGQGQLAMTIPVNFSLLDIVKIDTVFIDFHGDSSGGLALDAAISGSFVVGPVSAAVDRVGLSTTLKADSGGKGNLGMVDLGLGFKPPTGLGLSIDAAAVSGGGFISFDEAKGEYAGFLDISIVDMVQVKFIAILDTKLPDGSQGYSFIFIIFLELPPIQLGYGFTLNGVGGVAGINRTMVTSALQAGVYNHTLEYVINPPHTVADAPKVISAIGSFFPPAIGRYVFGPIVAVGWETFVQLTVGVILEVPDPIRLALLGIIDVGLPDVEEPDDAIVLLHVLVLGTIDFGTKKLAIDGSMYGSRILEFPILGDFTLRTSWGANSSSLFSMGGFNPHFNTSGLDVPQLHRMSISIGDGDNPQISANSYLALTSNTIQFGADVEVNVSEGGFKVHGYLGFDVLLVIAPPTISFEFDFAAGFDVSYHGANLAGVTVTGTLTGTTPWHFHGEGTVHLLCFSASKSVDKTWGDSITPLPPPAAILPDLIPALGDSRNWSAALPDGAAPGATLSAPPTDQKIILVHPMGTLTARQKIVPFDFSITHYKNGIPSDGHYFSLGDVTINGVKVSKGAFQDAFATGQFIDLSDADKLNRSSFDQYNAGAKIASSLLNTGADATRTVESNEYYLDDPISPLRVAGTYVMSEVVFGALSQPGTASRYSVKNTGLNKYKTGPSTPAAITKDPGFVVASTDDLSVRSDIVVGGATFYQAQAALKAHLAANPEDAGKLQIFPAHEVAP